MAVAIVGHIPHLGSPPIRAGHIIDLHSSCESVHTGRGYFTFADMVVCSAAHASDFDGFPNLAFLLQSKVAFLIL